MFRISVMGEIYNIRRELKNMNKFEKLAEGEFGGQKPSEVRPRKRCTHYFIQELQFYPMYNSSKSLFEADNIALFLRKTLQLVQSHL